MIFKDQKCLIQIVEAIWLNKIFKTFQWILMIYNVQNRWDRNYSMNLNRSKWFKMLKIDSNRGSYSNKPNIPNYSMNLNDLKHSKLFEMVQIVKNIRINKMIETFHYLKWSKVFQIIPFN